MKFQPGQSGNPAGAPRLRAGKLPKVEALDLAPDVAWVYNHPKLCGVGKLREYPPPPSRGCFGMLDAALSDEKSKQAFYAKVIASQGKHHADRGRDSVGEAERVERKAIGELRRVLEGLIGGWREELGDGGGSN